MFQKFKKWFSEFDKEIYPININYEEFGWTNTTIEFFLIDIHKIK